MRKKIRNAIDVPDKEAQGHIGESPVSSGVSRSQPIHHRLFCCSEMGSETRPNMIRITTTILGILDGGQSKRRTEGGIQAHRSSCAPYLLSRNDRTETRLYSATCIFSLKLSGWRSQFF